MSIDTEKERAVFERRFSASPFEWDFSRYPNDPSKFGWPGAYRDYNVECAWAGWLEHAEMAEKESQRGEE